MPVPDYQTLMRPVLEALSDGNAHRVRDILPSLIERYDLTPDEVEELLPSGTQTVLANRAHWARTYLSKAGLVQSSRRGFHEITDLGRKLLRSHSGPIGNATLAQFETFEEWRVPDRDSTQPGAVGDTAKTPAQATSLPPEEALEAAAAELFSALESDLLEAVLGMDPTRFEQLIVDLLLAMGYGDGKRQMAERLGKSSDGGIDGVVNEDPLGLDAVYIQAKRYDPKNTVGSPAIREFIGSLVGVSATKGVFVTTSSFSREAIAFLDRVQQRVVLIDGRRLAELMIRHGVGVRSRQTYVVKGVDEDYFGDA
ncbi:restriction system protein [Pseudooceanicola antarcticus]|uniref:Restriction endonuclease n=1 Tax=Pseudooceanicola antarcticus TaxID=1247613 RepID=A0A285HQD6_9RHOB|nr:restriction endonuclease [Pseudooceanicola antarcticus]PJE27672.1 restriction endonuclease [Pseudooceanicola antarcticus]SNY37915.1 restriction system protein [Pseudooceanicola antarcticus]